MAIQYGDGSNSNNGRVIQVVQTNYNSAFSSSFTSETAKHHLSMFDTTINLSSTSSKVKIELAIGSAACSQTSWGYYIYRGNSEVTGATGSSGNSRPASWFRMIRNQSDANHAFSGYGTYVDSPSTTGNVTYKIYFRAEGTNSGGTFTWLLNQDQNNSNENNMSQQVTSSRLVLTELAS
jgi:hypothetical protein